MPVDDALWEAPTASVWEAVRRYKPLASPLSLREAVASLFGDDSVDQRPDACWTWSPFATSVVMHAVAIAVWFLTQGKQVCCGPGKKAISSNSSEALLTEAALSRCRGLLSEARTHNDSTWNEADGPLPVQRICSSSCVVWACLHQCPISRSVHPSQGEWPGYAGESRAVFSSASGTGPVHDHGGRSSTRGLRHPYKSGDSPDAQDGGPEVEYRACPGRVGCR